MTWTPRARANVAVLAAFALVFVISLVMFGGWVLGMKQCSFERLEDTCNARCGGCCGHIQDRRCFCLVEPK